MYLLENWRYLIKMEAFCDVWAIHGTVYNRPGFEDGSTIYVSRPVKFDKDSRTITTYSGSVYKLGVCNDEDEERQFTYIEEDVQRHKKSES